MATKFLNRTHRPNPRSDLLLSHGCSGFWFVPGILVDICSLLISKGGSDPFFLQNRQSLTGDPPIEPIGRGHLAAILPGSAGAEEG